jgi:uncharacterized OB-fold protein
MVSWVDEAEELVHHGRIKVPYTWSVGETGSAFFVALRDERKILGSYCPQCDMVFLPPRKVCGRCFGRSTEWREVGHEGTLLTYTIPRYREKIHPTEEPFAFGVVKLDGADTGLTHLIGEFKERDLRSGMRVKAVFRDKPEGNILDIRYFRPV